MKRLFKRYRRLLNRFFVAVVVSVCLINTVSLDAQAAVTSNNFSWSLYHGTGRDGIFLFSGSYVNDPSAIIFESSPVAGRTYDPELYFSIVSDDFFSGNHFVLKFTFNWHLKSSLKPSFGWYYDRFYVVSPSYGNYERSVNQSGISYRLPNNGGSIYSSGGSSVTHSVGSPFISFSCLGSSYTVDSAGTGFVLKSDFVVSGDYNSINDLSFVFNPYVSYPDSSSDLGWLMFSISNVSLVVSGATTSDSENLQNLVDGYDSSSGNTASDKLDGSVSDFEQAEGSIFDSAQGHLKDFEFFDFNSIPAVVTGLSFVTSSMTAVFDAMGGLSGAGIVLSVLFAVMFLSIVIGLYRYFK